MDSHPDSSLLRLAYSQLYPDVFSHPVWIYFGDAGNSDSTELIQTLMRTCDQLQTHEDQSTVCQLLLLCAVLQLRSGNHDAAINTLSTAIELGERNGVSAIDCWASWGMSAVYIQLGKWQEAAKQLIHLKTQFTERGEWVLANIMELICECLRQNSVISTSATTDKPFLLTTDPFLQEALSWLKDWGTPLKLIDIPYKTSISQNDKDLSIDSTQLPIPLSRRIRIFLNTVKRLASGELRLRLVETNGKSRSIQVSNIKDLYPLPESPNHPDTLNILNLWLKLLRLFESTQYTGEQSPRDLNDYLQSTPTTRILSHSRESSIPSLAQPDPAEEETTSLSNEGGLTPKPADPLHRTPPQFIHAGKLLSTHSANLQSNDQLSSSRLISPQSITGPSMAVYCLGPFGVYLDKQPVIDWPSSKGKTIFKYLVANRERPVVKEVLMELFWPDVPPEAARNNLNVAIYGLRQAMRRVQPTFSHLLFQDDCYLLNPDLNLWVDYEAFKELISIAQALERDGDLDGALQMFCDAEALYQGDFMEEDRYEDWPGLQRQNLQDDYLSVLDCLIRHYYDNPDDLACTSMCRKLLDIDPYREEAHQYLMRSYLRQGHPHLALRQYHLCVKTLREELDITPSATTSALYEQIRQSKRR